MLTISEVKIFSEKEPNFDDMMCSIRAIFKKPKEIWKETKAVVDLAIIEGICTAM